MVHTSASAVAVIRNAVYKLQSNWSNDENSVEILDLTALLFSHYFACASLSRNLFVD